MNVSDTGFQSVNKKNNHQLELLYDQYKKYVYSIAYHYTGNKEDALDITQEVFLSIFKSIDKIKDEFSLLPWVKKITINRCLNFIRDRKDVVSLNQTIENGNEIQDLLQAADSTESKVQYLDTQHSLESAIKSLPPEERMAVILRHMKGMKYEDIARLMNIPLGTVKTFLHRARKSIKLSMKSDGIWEG